MNVYLPNLRLPSEYQEVEYIQSSGTQYIKIGTSFKTSYKTVIDFQMDVIGGDYIPIGINNYDGVHVAYKYGIDAYSSYFHVNAGGNWTSTIAEDKNRHTITIDKNTAIVDGTSYTINYSNYTYSSGICVFCYNEYNTSSPYKYMSSNKLYKLDIYDENGNYIFDGIPCYRKSDNVIGLYDLVNNQFYTNSGTGTFSKGNDVTMAVLKNAYIGEVYEYSYDFRNKTLSQLQADGWNETKYNSNCGLSYGSSGFSVSKINSSTTTGAGGLYFQLPSTISSTDKITMQFTGVGGSGDTRGRLFVSLTDVPTISLASSTQIETDLSTCIGSVSLPQGITCQKSVSGAQTWNVYELIRNVSGTSGFASAKCVLDLPNNKVSWEVTSPSSLAYSMEGTITTAGKNCIIGAKYFIVWGATFTVGINHQMQTASITIE